jgi:hypothetical protein
MIAGKNHSDSSSKLERFRSNKQLQEEILCERFDTAPQFGKLYPWIMTADQALLRRTSDPMTMQTW